MVIVACYTCGRTVLDTYVVRDVITSVVEIFITYVVKYCYKCGIYGRIRLVDLVLHPAKMLHVLSSTGTGC